jgi:hypothetical protein
VSHRHRLARISGGDLQLTIHVVGAYDIARFVLGCLAEGQVEFAATGRKALNSLRRHLGADRYADLLRTLTGNPAGMADYRNTERQQAADQLAEAERELDRLRRALALPETDPTKQTARDAIRTALILQLGEAVGRLEQEALEAGAVATILRNDATTAAAQAVGLYQEALDRGNAPEEAAAAAVSEIAQGMDAADDLVHMQHEAARRNGSQPDTAAVRRTFGGASRAREPGGG